MSLAWLSVPEWRACLTEAGFEVEALYGWFDRREWDGGEDSVWICRVLTARTGHRSEWPVGAQLSPGNAHDLAYPRSLIRV